MLLDQRSHASMHALTLVSRCLAATAMVRVARFIADTAQALGFSHELQSSNVLRILGVKKGEELQMKLKITHMTSQQPGQYLVQQRTSKHTCMGLPHCRLKPIRS